MLAVAKEEETKSKARRKNSACRSRYKEGIIKEAADKCGMKPEEIDVVYNNGKYVENKFSMREYKKNNKCY